MPKVPRGLPIRRGEPLDEPFGPPEAREPPQVIMPTRPEDAVGKAPSNNQGSAPPGLAPPRPGNFEQKRKEWERWWPFDGLRRSRMPLLIAAAVAAGIFWAATACGPPGPLVLCNYLSLISVFLLAGAAGWAKLSKRWPLIAGGAAAIAAVMLFGRLDRYHVQSNVVRDPETAEEVKVSGLMLFSNELWELPRTTYDDTYRRWSSTIVYRRIGICDGKRSNVLPSVRTEGPMTASGKPHGEWTEFYWERPWVKRRWYWYGEEISEGDFALRAQR